MTPATKAPRRARPAATRRQSVRVHRRVSGPARTARPPARAQAATARAVAAPLPIPPLGDIGLRVLRAGRSLQDSSLLDRLVRGRGWILVLGALLFGLVALNVSLLKLNAAAGHQAERAKELRIQNANLRGRVSRLASGDRLRAAAADMGMVMPEPKKVHYLKARSGPDGRQAARNVRNGVALGMTDDLVSATPQFDTELFAPTPPVSEITTPTPTPDPANGATAATGATGVTGAAPPTGTTGTTGAVDPQPAPPGG